jgi:TonB family protein
MTTAMPEVVPDVPPETPPETAPRYPAAAHGATGRVVVDCIIATDGQVYDCHVVDSDGGPVLAQAVLDWLTGPPAQRMPPVLRNGVAVEQLHRWAIYFQPPA